MRIFFGLLLGFAVLALEAETPALVLPFQPQRHDLYSRDELWTNYDSDPAKNQSLDWKIFQYFVKAAKYNPPPAELLAQRTHDTAMDSAVNKFFKIDDLGAPTTAKVVVVMGSHSKYRGDDWYQRAARLGFALTKQGYYVVTGGGPGLMEATHLGAYMSAYGAVALEDALAMLAKSARPANPAIKQYELPDYWARSDEVARKYPHGADSLGIPTWFYGHEGANAFSLHVAKYFSNALREEKLCSLGLYGIIFAPGGPGTQQEVFMDAAENGYGSYNWYSPMVFFDDDISAKQMQTLINETTSPEYRKQNLVSTTRKISEVLDFLSAHPPVLKK